MAWEDLQQHILEEFADASRSYGEDVWHEYATCAREYRMRVEDHSGARQKAWRAAMTEADRERERARDRERYRKKTGRAAADVIQSDA